MTIRKRKICVVTGSRAEYGLMYWLLKEMLSDDSLELKIIVTGSHLSHEFGLTYKEIESDGFLIDYKVEMLLSDDSEAGIAKSIGLGVIGFSDAYKALQPDIIVVLGDRYEILAAVQAALIFRIPVGHIHGGESCEALIDDSIRHAITKMSHLHFTAAEFYRKRVIQMGENPDRVFCFGGPGLDHIYRTKLLSDKEIRNELGLGLNNIIFIVTYHAITLSKSSPMEAYKKLFSALDSFPGVSIVFTCSNADTDGRVIFDLLENYCNSRGNCHLFESLGYLRYMSLVKSATVVIGNSSSGLIEVPFLKVATVNIGDRQQGRLRASSVLDCSEEANAIISAIKMALSRDFQESLEYTKTEYVWEDAAKNTKEVIAKFPLENILYKKFYNLKQEEFV